MSEPAYCQYEEKPAVHAGLPVCREQDLPDDVAKAAATIADVARRGNGKPGFLWARSILRSPRWYADLSRCLAEKHPEAEVVVVDPYTFFGLVRLQSD